MTQESFVDTNPKYWDEYTNLQRVKHELIREYLNGWLPKLGYSAGRIVYIDTHAGRGTHLQGELGSPLVALKTFLEHNHRDRILERSQVVFWFIERDEENLILIPNLNVTYNPIESGDGLNNVWMSLKIKQAFN